MSRSDDHSDDGKSGIPDCGDAIDAPTFEQILEMDDDERRDFSRELVYGFFEQSSTTLGSMDEAIKQKDLQKLSNLGHYLKGSSATLGLTRVRDQCEKIQHLGSMKTETGETAPWNEDEGLQRIKDIMPRLKDDCKDVEMRLRAFYEHLSANH